MAGFFDETPEDKHEIGTRFWFLEDLLRNETERLEPWRFVA
jgi:hypothetical protein